MIVEKTPRERAAMQFKAAGLGDRSAHEAARLLFQTGMSFETAAVMGQRLGEECSATPTSIREAANRHRSATAGPRTKTAWGRALSQPASPTSVGVAEASPRVVEETVLIDGVPHKRVTEYSVVEKPAPRTTTPWGRPASEASSHEPRGSAADEDASAGATPGPGLERLLRGMGMDPSVSSGEPAQESTQPRATTAWGRPATDQEEA